MDEPIEKAESVRVSIRPDEMDSAVCWAAGYRRGVQDTMAILVGAVLCLYALLHWSVK